MTDFERLGLSEALQDALRVLGYSQPTPIQQKAIPSLLAGRDLLALAQTGTGKTAAFTLPLLQRLSETARHPIAGSPAALILAPTRELAIQIGESVSAYGRNLKIRHTVVVGGVAPGPQIRALRQGVHVLIATTGRLLDHLQAGHVRLDRTAMLVLDEADRMFDMGFVRDIRKIAALLPRRRQTALFSATMPAEIARLAGEILHEPEAIEVRGGAITVERICQQVIFVEQGEKLSTLKSLLKDETFQRTIIFTRTKRGADRVARQISRGDVSVEAIHGDKSQSARQRALARFGRGQASVLVATDIAARGIDIDDVTHVINYDLPNEPESYVHRIGRTARGGSEGTALSLCTPADRDNLRAIEKLTRLPLAVLGQGGGNSSRPSATAPAKPRGNQTARAAGAKHDADRTNAPKRNRRRSRRPNQSRSAA